MYLDKMNKVINCLLINSLLLHLKNTIVHFYIELMLFNVFSCRPSKELVLVLKSLSGIKDSVGLKSLTGCHSTFHLVIVYLG